jgi:hypothetical protein
VNNKSYITNILLAIIPLILVVGYFERYLNLIPQYFFSDTVFASSETIEKKSTQVQLKELETIPTTLIDKISSVNVPEWKVSRVRSFLKNRGAPLATKARYLVQAAQYYGIDYRLVASISIIESSGGKNTYRPYNAWGWGGAENAFTFKSWEDSITTVSRGLAGYYAGGAVTPTQIAPTYNPHTPKEWARKVTFIMAQM